MLRANESSLDFVSLASLDLPPQLIYPAFIFGLITFLITIFCNVLIIVTIAASKDLHKPMFLLLVNLPIGDIIGSTAFLPQFLISMVTQNRLISYPACITQAFLLHFYGTANLFTLCAMAYDRFIAICDPLRYNTIMTPQKVTIFIVWVWLLDFAIIFCLFMLLVRFKICRNNLVDLMCNNPSLMKLICENTMDNNYYGLFLIVLIQGSSLLIMLYTYSQILKTCLRASQTEARRKAIQTCLPHLVTFLMLDLLMLFSLVTHRFQNAFASLRNAFGTSLLIFPPFLDPIIYGLQVKELRKNIVRMWIRRVDLK